MKYTLLFNVDRMPIQWHDESPKSNLFGKPAGTTDPKGTGWVSTGIVFESGEESWTYWVCRIVELALTGKKCVTAAEVVKLIDYLVAFRDGKDLYEFIEKYDKI